MPGVEAARSVLKLKSSEHFLICWRNRLQHCSCYRNVVIVTYIMPASFNTITSDKKQIYNLSLCMSLRSGKNIYMKMQHKNLSLLLLPFFMSLYQHALEDSVTYCRHEHNGSHQCFMLTLSPSHARYPPCSAALTKLHAQVPLQNSPYHSSQQNKPIQKLKKSIYIFKAYSFTRYIFLFPIQFLFFFMDSATCFSTSL